MVETTFLDSLKKLGLNDYEARGYLALLERRSLTATQISVVSGIPRTKVYDVTESLMKKGLCSLVPGKINKYRALEIDAVAQNLLSENERIFNERKRQIREAAQNLEEQLSAIYGDNNQNDDPLEYIEIIKDPYQIHKRFLALVKKAKEEVLVFTKPPFAASPEESEDQLDQETEILKKGVKTRSIYEIAEEDPGWLFEHLKRAVKVGEEARVIAELPMKMAIFDSRIVMYVLEDPLWKQKSFTTQVVEHRALAKALKLLFESLWEQAKDYRTLKD